jgi:integrase
MGLGPVPLFSLQEARAKALRARLERYEGRDPLGDRPMRQLAIQAPRLTRERGKSATFSECARAYIAAHRPRWRAARHGRLWERSLATYAEPVIGMLPVSAIDTDHVLQVLQPVWSKVPQTAKVIRGRIEAVLDWAKAKGYRVDENPARWQGHLENLLPRHTRTVEHFAALPYDEVPTFIAKLRSHADQATAPAMIFLILTAARAAEVRGAMCSEIDMDGRLWVIPASRMKKHREHRVPLSEPAMAILRHQMTIRTNGYVFPGQRTAQMSERMLRTFVHLVGGFEDRATVHGFRSSFRDWAGDCTDVPREVIEAALAHAVGDKTEQSYRRGDALAKRRALMDEWARYLDEHIPEKRNRIPAEAGMPGHAG